MKDSFPAMYFHMYTPVRKYIHKFCSPNSFSGQLHVSYMCIFWPTPQILDVFLSILSPKPSVL